MKRIVPGRRPSRDALPATLDRRLYAAVNRLPHQPDTDRLTTLLSDLGKGVGWAAAGAALAAAGGSRGRRAAVASVGGMLVAVTLVQGPGKTLLRRRRPFVDRIANVVGTRPSDSSFPSGHTAGSFAAAIALSVFYPRWRWPAFGLAGAVGASRIYLGHHFPSDVAFGAVLGGAVGAVAARLLRLRPAAGPQGDPEAEIMAAALIL
ncbi:MAG: phosphatase PAP2 family protein [Candidatus Dormibacteraeota bacterium]|nr:phosphatase PAP2 family protein [Candidatus Dormibacteraeota bacterium]